MRIRLGTLRELIYEISSSGGAWPGQLAGRNVTSPDVNAREQLGAISAKAIDTVADPDGLPDHLLDPTVTPEECEGPVPPNAEDPYVGQDPFARDYAPQPFSGGKNVMR